MLKPGGRVAVSDIALKQPLPPEVGQDILAYVGCIAGADPRSPTTSGMLREAGFAAVQVMDTRKDLNAYAQVESQSGCCGDSCWCDAAVHGTTRLCTAETGRPASPATTSTTTPPASRSTPSRPDRNAPTQTTKRRQP